ncbi:MAG TPA: hypothetical protein V6D10_00020 [Trichocoleus sp.]|jgi:hypothetical protein
MKKVPTRGSKKGRCNICGTLCTLTEDHVPPKGSIKPQKVEIKSLAQSVDPIDPKITQLSQNGVKFRSLCSLCNNHRLGKEFDPALNSFSRSIAQIIRNRSHLSLPSRLEIRLKPQRVVRSIIGHLLAAEIREEMSSSPVSEPIRDLMRQYFLDALMDLPSEFNVYCWPYSAKHQVILKGIGILSGNQIVIGDFLKYFPVAFWLTYQAPDEVREVMQDREISVRGNGVDEWSTVLIGTNKQDTFRPNWPESPDDNEIVVINDDVCFVATAT